MSPPIKHAKWFVRTAKVLRWFLYTCAVVYLLITYYNGFMWLFGNDEFNDYHWGIALQSAKNYCIAGLAAYWLRKEYLE